MKMQRMTSSVFAVALSSALVLLACDQLGLKKKKEADEGEIAAATPDPTPAPTAVPTPAPTPEPTPTRPEVKLIFATSELLAGNVGDAAAADQKCTSLAVGAGLGGTWKAFMAHDNQVLQRIEDVGPWYLTDGTTRVFENKAAFATGPEVAISKTETGADVTAPAAWTGLYSSVSKGYTCNAWTSNAAGSRHYGTYGQVPQGADSSDSGGWLNRGYANCGVSLRVLCFDDSGVGTQKVFVTSTTLASDAGGLTQADALCQARATAGAMGGGSWKAFLSDASTNAIDRITTNGPWYLKDGTTPVFADKAQWAVKPTNVIDKDELGATLEAGTLYWSGSLGNGTRSENTCLGWTDSYSGGLKDFGFTESLSASGSAFWSSRDVEECNIQLPILCIEQ